MRRTIIAITVLAVALIAYQLWPLQTLLSLARAVESRDVAQVRERIDFGALRRSLSEQVIRTYLQISGANLSPATRRLAATVGPSFTDVFLERIVNPEAIIELLHGGWPSTVVPERPAGFEGLRTEAIGSAWHLWWKSEYGIGKFYAVFPADKPSDQQYGIRLTLSRWKWRLTGIELPPPTLERLAQELIREQGRR